MDQDAARFVTSTIVLEQPLSMTTQTRRVLPGPSGQDVTITLTGREWQILATIVNDLGRPWIEIVKAVERLRESDLDAALRAIH